MTWIAMIAIIVFCYFATRKVTTGRPGGAQNVLEWVFEFIKGLITGNMDWKKGRSLLTYLVTLIMFIFFSNMLGLFPNLTFGLLHNVHFLELNEIFHGPTLASPTADVNTTLALAILTWFLFNGYGIFYNKGKYFKHFLEPMPPFVVIHLVEQVTKPMTLGMRLFGNIFAGEILIKVILTYIPTLALFLGGFVLNTVWLGFSVFVGAIQSFVFTVLTLAYVSQGVGSDEHH
ncbi:MAG TPA: F0F1 ATP synthase subunit A [Verrucomicrobiae bacterium]|nr:F0F1 ATP synthase subunit A [Verrucomicrobiae bacterium]